MITTYNYPGASSFRAVHHERNAADRQAARNWWAWVHELNGPCAPGGGNTAPDREAAAWKYRDGQRVIDFQQIAKVTAERPKNIPKGWGLTEGPRFFLLTLEA